MSIEKHFILGNTNIGVYLVATDKFVLHTSLIRDKTLSILTDTFKVPLIPIINDLTVIGTVILANNSGIVLSSLFNEETEVNLKKELPDINVSILKNEYYAIGNTGVSNDRTTILSPIVNKENTKIIEDTLDTEIIQRQLGGTDLVGSLVRTTNDAAAIGLYIQEEEVIDLKNILKVSKAEYTTVNRGFYFPSSGLIVNENGILCGEQTTGIELARIADLFLLS